MPRFPKLFDQGSLRRTGIALLILLGALGLVYWWQPQRYDFIERRPPGPLPRLDLAETGLFDRGKRVMVVTAHPDDEAFYLGGTLYKLEESGAKTTLVVLTDGDKGYYPFFDSKSLAKVRQRETRESAAKVGIEDVVFFEYPDGRLSFDREPVSRLAKEILKLNPEIVFSYEPEYWPRVGHRDHRVGGEIARAALKQAGFRGWSLYYHTVAPNTFADVGKEWLSAQELLGVHASQFNGERLRLIRGIVSEAAIASGERFGTDFAEAFRAVDWS